MYGLTILLSFIGAVLILFLRPALGLSVYVGMILLYPRALTIPLGISDFNLGRILIIVLLVKLIFHPRILSRFRWSMLDTTVVIACLASVFALLQNAPTGLVINREGGTLLDTILVYFAARLAVQKKADLLSVFKTLVLVAIPLAFLGLIEARTNYNPYNFFAPYYGFDLQGITGGYETTRRGFHRASGSFNNAIIFGLFFTVLIPVCFALASQYRRRRPFYFALAILLVLGTLSSLSSAPLSALIVTGGMLILFPFRRFWPVFVAIFIAFLLFVEVYSNRHFYHVLAGFGFSSENAYYRIALVEEAFGGGMKGHWIFGYGYVGIGPGNDNTFFNWVHMDLVNIYIRILARTGLLGLFTYLVVNFLYYKRLYQAARVARGKRDKWLVWCFASGLLGWNVAMLTVSALSQAETLLYLYIGLCGVMPMVMRQTDSQPVLLYVEPWPEEPANADDPMEEAHV